MLQSMPGATGRPGSYEAANSHQYLVTDKSAVLAELPHISQPTKPKQTDSELRTPNTVYILQNNLWYGGTSGGSIILNKYMAACLH